MRHHLKKKHTIFFSLPDFSFIPEVKSSVWLFDMHNNFRIQAGPNMNYKRSYFTCGLFLSNAHEGRPIVVVAGGGYLSDLPSEYWDFTKDGAAWELSSKIQ